MIVNHAKCDEPLVSIIVLVYNHENFIIEALDSILSQKVDFDFEIVVHDDCSTDGTVEILKKYKLLYPEKITLLLEEENIYSKDPKMIMQIIRNYLRGKYIAFCEGDDYWLNNNKLAHQISFLENNKNYSAVVHAVDVIDENKQYIGTLFSSEEERDVSELNGFLDFAQTTSYCMINPWHKNFYSDLSEFISGWDKSFVIYMFAMGKVHVLTEHYSCYRHIKNCGTSSETRENLNNLTVDKIRSEYDLYNQLKNYSIVKNNHYMYSRHYHKNVTLYSFKKLIKKPSIKNFKLFLLGIRKSPYPFWTIFPFIIQKLLLKYEKSKHKKI